MTETINYGIDLGTTNSSIAKYDGKEIKIFKNRDQHELTPSVVRIEKSGRIIVGRRAYQTLFLDPENVHAEFKRLMGQNDRVTFKAIGKSLSPEELSAEVLKSVLMDARMQTTDQIDSAVITVPAAFGQLQCEATARAANLAGLIEAPLLQEPIAAAIAYGMKEDSRDNRWMIYDLGGGTIDIAIVSTKDGHLSILEHQGDNMLGGKDFDRLIVEKILFPSLAKEYSLPDNFRNTSEWRKIYQLLIGKAEEAKIELSFIDRTIVNIYGIGNDLDGNPIEAEITLTRDEINPLVQPFILRTIELCKNALKKAKLEPSDIEKIILVGGPTFMPLIREMLVKELGIPLDLSIDPMTVVARGASVYASTIPHQRISKKPSPMKGISLNLAYEKVWSETTAFIAGKVENVIEPGKSLEILIEAESGHWSSGWIPIQNNYFETPIHLMEGKNTRFRIHLRDEVGNDIAPVPDSFSIRHGLTLAEPPLPHSIGVEVVRFDGKKEIDVIFPRSSPLPVHKVITYKASKTLNPTNFDDYLAIKVWEGEAFFDPEANNIVGVLKIRADELRRPIPEGTEIEISLDIDTSRLMKVEALVPLINQHFFERVYVPKESEEEIVNKVGDIETDVEEYLNRFARVNEIAQLNEDNQIREELDKLNYEFDDLDQEIARLKKESIIDPDDAKRVLQRSKNIRSTLSKIELKVEAQNKLIILIHEYQDLKNAYRYIVYNWGDLSEQKEFELLCQNIEHQIEGENEKKLARFLDEIQRLYAQILWRQDWYAREYFESLQNQDFIDKIEAEKLIANGKSAIRRGDGDGLRQILFELISLLPKSETGREEFFEPGIRKK